jgi:hypothetical protein
MRSLIAAAVIATVAATGACSENRHEGAGPTVSRNYQVGNFDRIEVAGPYDVKVSTGSAASASARGPENMIERMVVEVKDGTLQIHPRENKGFSFHWGNSGHVELAVTVPQLKAASIAGSGDVAVDHVRGDQFEGAVGGSGTINLGSVEVKSVKLSIGGSGDIKASSGTAQSADYSIAGSGNIDAGGVTAQQAKVSIAGSGSTTARATGAADVSVAGSGDVEISGGAQCKVDKAGSGDVRCS